MNRIKSLRKKNGMKQIELCQMLGITQGALSGWENEKYDPDINSIQKLSDIFNVSIDYLLGRVDDNLELLNIPSSYIKVPVLGKIPAGIPITR